MIKLYRLVSETKSCHAFILRCYGLAGWSVRGTGYKFPYLESVLGLPTRNLPFRKTASTKKECTCIRSMHVYPRVGGGFCHLMARALLDRTVGCGVNNSPALRFLWVDWVGLVVGFA